jgi:hypothetical protein
MRRIRHRVAVGVTTPLLALALTGCEALNTAAETADKAKICAEALGAAGFNPDASDPQKSVDEAKERAEQLRKLADQAADANLQRELREMADSLGQLKLSDLDPSNAAAWADQKLKQLEQLQKACS